jgi:histidine triad (HIT) family protein
LSDRADCIFCKIVAGEIPSTEVASSEFSHAFRDLNPVAPVHVLVVPKAHVRDATELGDDHGATLADMLQLARSIATSEGIIDGGYRLVFNVGDDAGNSVPHLHMHVLGGRVMAWPPG